MVAPPPPPAPGMTPPKPPSESSRRSSQDYGSPNYVSTFIVTFSGSYKSGLVNSQDIDLRAICWYFTKSQILNKRKERLPTWYHTMRQRQDARCRFQAPWMPACRYVEENGSAAMPATKMLAGVTIELNLGQYIACTPLSSANKAAHSGFEKERTMGRHFEIQLITFRRSYD